MESEIFSTPKIVHAGKLFAYVLEHLGIQTIFTVPGGHTLGVLDGLLDTDIKVVDCHHETSAAQMALGWSYAAGDPGVVLITAGPGFTHATTAIVDAATGHVPMLVIAGRTKSKSEGTGAVGDIDQQAIAKSLGCRCVKISTKDPIAGICQFIQDYTTLGKTYSGPLYVEVSADINSVSVNTTSIKMPVTKSNRFVDNQQIEYAANIIRSASKPVLLCGSGTLWSHADIESFCSKTHIPAVTASGARGIISDSNYLCLGSIFHAAAVLNQADVVIIAGSRLNANLLFGGPPLFSEESHIIMIDIDQEAAISKRKIDAFVQGDAQYCLEALADLIGRLDTQQWVEHAKSTVQISESFWRQEVENTKSSTSKLHPADIVITLTQIAPNEDMTLVIDGGDILMWSLPFARAASEGSVLTTTTALGTVGVGVPFALAAKAAKTTKPTVLIVGDGSFMYALSELDTAIRHNLPFVAVVANNSCWADVKHFQQHLFGKDRISATVFNRNIDYAEIAKAFGWEATTVENVKELANALTAALRSNNPYLVNAVVDPDAESQLLASLSQVGLM